MKNIESFKLFENNRENRWLRKLIKDIKKLKSNPLYQNEERKSNKILCLENRERIFKILKELFRCKLVSRKYGYLYVTAPIKNTEDKGLGMVIFELEDEYFQVVFFIQNTDLENINFICDQESGLYSLMKEIKKIID